MIIENAHLASYPAGWHNYQARYSHDQKLWKSTSTHYENDQLIIEHTPSTDCVWFAYFAPFSLEQHQALLSHCCAQGAELETLGKTLDGHSMDVLKIGSSDPSHPVLWLLARQHPGESMGGWWMKGLLHRLLDPFDPLALKLLHQANFYVVPNMNPDGCFRGNLRTNAAGVNLNREWENPSMDKSPEVYLVREAMRKTGMHLCLDVHGDETIPYNFIHGPNGIPSFHALLGTLLHDYQQALIKASPDFQDKHGYPITYGGEANMTLCTNHVAEYFGALGMTLEQPFKDNANAPNPNHGWSPERCEKFGAATLNAIDAVIDRLSLLSSTESTEKLQ